MRGRIDVFPMERRVGQTLILQIFSASEREQIVMHPRPIDEFRAYLLLSRTKAENARRMAAFDRGFRRLKARGRYDWIMQHCAP